MASNSNSNIPDSLSILESEFSKYGKFTLLDALKDMDVANPEEIVKASTAKSADAMRLQEKSISLEDGAAIAAYFYTGPECVDGAKAPVRNAVNDVLFDFTADKRRKLEKIKRYLYLFLKALRGLQRYHAKNFTLYRNIRVYVDPKVDLSSQLPTVWWDFPYVSTDMSKADDPTFNNFVYGQQADGYIIENVKCIITEKGDGPWGYDVSRYTNAKNNMSTLNILSFSL